MYFKEWVDRFLIPIDDPGSRLFHLNLICSFLFILIYLIVKARSLSASQFSKALRLVFRKRYWWNRSTKVDYQIYFLNSILKIFLFIPFLDFSFRIARWTTQFLLSFHDQEMMNLKSSYPYLLTFTIAAFIFDDFLRFFHHVLMHKIPVLWALHQTHHSARILTPITLYRTHPLESAMATVRNSISTGVSIGAFIFIFGSQFSLLTVFGINFFGFVFNILGSNLRHSHIPISFGIVENVFISPQQHQIHHSTNALHFNKNFGVSLAIWDKCIGAWQGSSGLTSSLKFGLAGSHRQSLSILKKLHERKSHG